MRLVQFLQNGRQCLGLEVFEGGDIVNLNHADETIPHDMRTFIECGEDMWKRARSVSNRPYCLVHRDNVKLLAPITSCEKVLCIGMNYRDHCKEQNAPIPDDPVVFNRFPSCINGPNDDLSYPGETEYLDWEAELAIVVGKQAKNIQLEDAMQYVFGYTAANDVCARDWVMKNGGQVLLSSAMDQTCPLGPSLVTTDELGDPHNLNIRCKVNGAIKQDSNTSQLIYKTEKIISHITRFITLKPGDVILTGSPPGVGHCMNPPEYLQVGDLVEVELEKIGTIKTKIVRTEAHNYSLSQRS
ncbi:fumarylacetoacetate hydrolase domain-containing protein 2-like [Mercenaria mercenaria]|uniref:fumarylacetoacetate hydrolase domain-containing protein 2-like n=1 Tax=Mercenaria mercenaria TaxID=6596 RepID=UPI00234F633B|nr:fumarylacetoacetate hydrolase domain-containing protein 2-like [Mercenaria mercenaria]